MGEKDAGIVQIPSRNLCINQRTVFFRDVAKCIANRFSQILTLVGPVLGNKVYCQFRIAIEKWAAGPNA
jgi:hypothetical protein